jgi:hypothetical protein
MRFPRPIRWGEGLRVRGLEFGTFFLSISPRYSVIAIWSPLTSAFISGLGC